MPLDHTDPHPALQRYVVTYSPAHTPLGVPFDKTASRQVLRERLTAPVEALNVDDAVQTFERQTGRMVTACKRVQLPGVQL